MRRDKSVDAEILARARPVERRRNTAGEWFLTVFRRGALTRRPVLYIIRPSLVRFRSIIYWYADNHKTTIIFADQNTEDRETLRAPVSPPLYLE